MAVETFSSAGAQATLYLDGPDWEGQPTMTVGKFKCTDASSGADLLEQIARVARIHGATALLGPMDGDTWHTYRLICDTDGRKPFLMEPSGGTEDQAAFERAGFIAISHYFSASVPLDQVPHGAPGATDTLIISCWDGTDPEGLFAQVHDLSCRAFSNNPFYKPIALEDFLALYMPFVPLLKRELILFAHDPDQNLAGFLFGIPNYAEGPQSDTAILKTYASLQRGAGYALSSRFYTAARDLGYRTAIHALIHDNNLSALRSQMNGAAVFRRYALMGRRLDG
ncbi:hypothetical protein [Actibacterium sp. 188UL27-1]|uniref:hypothetical protein n=1 Tax=Actibacterium sp. 188UL27-1 TaxID=2786961 RepID=UPI00195BFC8F|nr:hypothetical protein [Actibacterium sp. 188UL27-1]MBM7067431.1 hypothetical protein [Actibacterium sp. 188UL27-1]